MCPTQNLLPIVQKKQLKIYILSYVILSFHAKVIFPMNFQTCNNINLQHSNELQPFDIKKNYPIFLMLIKTNVGHVFDF
jgi:hypothetical protein